MEVILDVILVVVFLCLCMWINYVWYIQCEKCNSSWYQKVLDVNDDWADFVKDMNTRIYALEKQVLELSRDKQEGGNDE